MRLQDKVYFGHGPLEFIGIVTAVCDAHICVLGVETGCLATAMTEVDIAFGGTSLRVIDEEEWVERTKNEPAFSAGMSKERFLELQSELGRLEGDLAASEPSEVTEFRAHEIRLLLKGAPWSARADGVCSPRPQRTESAAAIPA